MRQTGNVTDDIRLGFDRVPELYTEVRPTYPDELFEQLFSLLPNAPHIVEVGPGTGQATEALLRNGASVQAIELGAQLAASLLRRLSDFDGLDVQIGDFETLPVTSPQADAIVAATCYHWISDAAKIDRPAEVLAPGGVLAIIDTNQVDDAADKGYFDVVNPIYAKFGRARAAVPPTAEVLEPAMQSVMEADARCADVSVLKVRRDLTYSTANYEKLLRTYSGTQSLSTDDREAMLAALIAVANEQFGGEVTRPIVFTLTTCRINS